MSVRRTIPFWVGVFFSSVGALAQTPTMGPEFVASTPNAGVQDENPSVAMVSSLSAPARDFVVVWDGYPGPPPPPTLDVYARRFDVFGAAQGGEFTVNTNLSSLQYFPDIAMDDSGNFVVVWTSYLQDGDYGGIYAQRHSPSGAKQGSEFRVNSYTTSYQNIPRVARHSLGSFVVVWESYGQDGDDTGVFAQRYDSSGVAQGPEFRVNTYTTGFQGSPDVALLSAGGFVVVWESYGQDGSDDGVFAQRYDGSGVPQGSEFRVNTHTTDTQDRARVAPGPSGGFVVVWDSDLQDGDSSGIFGRRYDGAGVAQGAEFLVNTFTTGGQTRPDVAMTAGNFVVVWEGQAGIFGQRFDSSARRVGSEFQLSMSTTQNHDRPRVATGVAGNFVVVWETSNGPVEGVLARRAEFRAAGVMRVDEPAPGAVEVRAPDGVANNRMLEPGETVSVEPTWTNTLEGTPAVAGTASAFTGPAGGVYSLNDATADYGSVAFGATANCRTATGDCYQMTVSGAPRPATHWDGTFLETLGNNVTKTWTLHVGESFTDVPASQLFYRAIESVLHGGITAGCTATTYCPGDQVTRSQMSLFLARGVAGGGFAIPNSGQVGGNVYTCGAGGTSLFTDVLPTDIFCRSVHYLAAQNVTTGCSATQYCPAPNVTRLEMSAFVARAVVAPGGGAAVPLTYGPDPVTGFSYSCDQSSPNTFFTDVPASNGFCKHAHFLWARGIISGCGATTYCPNDPVTRDAMARFLTNGFGVQLYGP